MTNYKEIVTKAVIGKGKKIFKNKYEIITEETVDTVLGCWVINHNMIGVNNNGSVAIKGNYDVNIWYSYDNNTKTKVAIKNVSYEELVNVKLKEESTLTDQSEILIKSLKNPTCTFASNENNIISFEIEKELGIEIIGDTKVKIAIFSDDDDYDLIEDITDENLNSLNNIDNEITENYIKEK
jgi:spore coat protein E